MFGRKISRQAIIQRGAWTWRLRPELAERLPELEAQLFSPAARAEARPVKETGGRRTIWTLPLDAAGVPLAFVKHYSRPRFAKQLKHLVRNSRTRQEWEMGIRLEALGLPVARHLAMAERRRAGLLQEDYLIQEALAGHENFDAWFREKWAPVREGPRVQDRRAVVARLADLIRKMHDRGVLQRDFKPDSIMVGPAGEFKLVDLERALVVPWPGGLPLAIRLDNLAKLDQTFGFIGSASDRLRFLRRYFQNSKVTDEKLRNFASTIADLAELKFRKRARERRVWAESENATYRRERVRGYRVSAHWSLSPRFIEQVIEKLEQGLVAQFRDPELGRSYRALWCEARTALAHTPSLYYRRAPFVPARAAIYPGQGPWGLLIYLDPGLPLVTWKEGAAAARASGAEIEFAASLGQALRVFHRMGITWREYGFDAMLHDPTAPPLSNFYLNRLDLVLLDRSPSPAEAPAILERVCDLLSLSGPARAALTKSYARSRLRWFRQTDRW